MADIFVRNQRCYPQIQSAFDTIPNSSGTATVANADCCLITELTTDADIAQVVRPDLTGSLDSVSQQLGRRSSTWRARLSMAGNGAAGVAPDAKNFLQSAFGAAGVVVASTSVTYSLADTLYYLAVYNFLTGNANATQRVAFNALVNRMEVALGGDVPFLTFNGENGWTYDNDQAADGATPAAAKGGLSAFPAEPSTPVVNGTHPLGFKLAATIDGNAYTTVQSATISMDVARELRKDTNNEFPQDGAAGERKVMLDLVMDDDDTANMRSLKQKAMRDVAMDISLVCGTVAGNIWTWTLKNVKMSRARYGASGVRRTVTFTGCRAYPTSISVKDHLVLAIT